MPFTLAHPAAVLPLIRSKRFSATALMAGSMAPDFEYFFKMSTGSIHSHTLAGILYFDLPVSILLAFAFHYVVRDRLIDNLPEFAQQRLHPLRHFNLWKYIQRHHWIFIYSAIVGVSSHLLWDSFTHAGGFAVNKLTIFSTARVPFDGVQYPLWYALQNISTYLGMAILLVYFLLVKPLAYRVTSVTWYYWMVMIVVTGAIFYLRYRFGPTMNFGNVVVSMMTALFCGLLAASRIHFKAKMTPS